MKRYLPLAVASCFVVLGVACSDDETTTTSSSTTSTTASGTGGSATGGGGASTTTGTGGDGGTAGMGGSGGAAPMTLTSSAYDEGGTIPDQYSCQGANISPPLSYTPGPAGTMSYTIVFRDLTNGLGHSAIFDIPASITTLPEDVDKSTMPADVPGALQSPNYANQPGYAGPCPSNTHTYEFTLYAVDVATLGLNATTVDVDDVEAAAQAASLAEATLSATFTP